MLSALFASFKSVQVGTSFMQAVLGLIQHLDANYVVDGSARNAVIDDLCQALQAHKVSVAPVAPAAPVAPVVGK